MNHQPALDDIVVDYSDIYGHTYTQTHTHNSVPFVTLLLPE